jgi:hypothetical protein
MRPHSFISVNIRFEISVQCVSSSSVSHVSLLLHEAASIPILSTASRLRDLSSKYPCDPFPFKLIFGAVSSILLLAFSWWILMKSHHQPHLYNFSSAGYSGKGEGLSPKLSIYGSVAYELLEVNGGGGGCLLVHRMCDD